MIDDDAIRRALQAAADRAGGEVAENLLMSVNLDGRGVRHRGMSAVSGSRLLGGVAAAGLVVGGGLGFTLLGSDDGGGGSAAADVQLYSLYDCPDGAIAGGVYAGDRVYVTGRDEGGGWYEVRDPRDQSRVVWVPAGAVDPDQVVDVPVRECAEPVELVPGDESTTTTTTQPGSPTTVETTDGGGGQGQGTTTVPSTVPDAVKPTLGQPGRSPSQIFDSGCGAAFAQTSNISVTATDNVAVTQVTGTYSGLGGSPLSFTKGGGNTWTATFGPFTGLALMYEQNITITIVARDAAGNTSNPTQISVEVNGAGTCPS